MCQANGIMMILFLFLVLLLLFLLHLVLFSLSDIFKWNRVCGANQIHFGMHVMSRVADGVDCVLMRK